MSTKRVNKVNLAYSMLKMLKYWREEETSQEAKDLVLPGLYLALAYLMHSTLAELAGRHLGNPEYLLTLEKVDGMDALRVKTPAGTSLLVKGRAPDEAYIDALAEVFMSYYPERG